MNPVVEEGNSNTKRGKQAAEGKVREKTFRIFALGEEKKVSVRVRPRKSVGRGRDPIRIQGR